MDNKATRELAEELEIAGFPYRHVEGFPYIPELSELIEACGESFNTLRYYRLDKFWGAHANAEAGITASCKGETPEEAVARLWLELN